MAPPKVIATANRGVTESASARAPPSSHATASVIRPWRWAARVGGEVAGGGAVDQRGLAAAEELQAHDVQAG